MIESYTGTPGCGKTYHAVYEMWEVLKYGGTVITNIPLTLPKKGLFQRGEYDYNFWETMEITPKRLIDYSEKRRKELGVERLREDCILLVIDEAQLLFNCRDWNARGRGEWVKFFQLHRKLGYHIVLVTQINKMLDRQIQGLLEYETLHRKFSNFGIKGKLVTFAMFTSCAFACVRMWSVLRERIDCKVLRYSRRIARMYDTGQMFWLYFLCHFVIVKINEKN